MPRQPASGRQGGKWRDAAKLRRLPSLGQQYKAAAYKTGGTSIHRPRAAALFDPRPCVSQSRRAALREPETSMSTTNGSPQPQMAMPQIGVITQYVKDFSFENPHAPRSLAPSSQPP